MTSTRYVSQAIFEEIENDIQEYGPCEVITVVVPIDPFTADNGCTNVALNWKDLAQERVRALSEYKVTFS